MKATRLVAAIVGLVMMSLGLVGALAPAQAAPNSLHVPIRGSGSSWSGNMIAQWVANVRGNYGWVVNYTSSGSTVGRTEFASSLTQFGASDIPYAAANSNEQETLPARGFSYMPIVAGGTVFMYNLKIGGKRVTNLRLSGDTVAKIFTGVITTWSDKQIADENPALALPSIPIIPVVRSDGAGETAQFTTWLRQEHSALWDGYCGTVGRPTIAGHCGITSNYPIKAGSRFVAQAGANGVAAYTAADAAAGAITMVQYSYALNLKFPVAKLLNNAGYYTEPTASNVAVALLQAKINYDKSSVNYLTQDLSSVFTGTDKRSYALSSYSYVILPTPPRGPNGEVQTQPGLTTDQGLTLADFAAYFLCEGQRDADTSGYSPLPINLVQAGQEQIKKIPGADPIIKGTSDCNNPTFDPTDTSATSNKLARTAPYPPDCDKAGPVQCTTGTGGAKDTPTAATKGSGAGGTPNGGSVGGGDGGTGGAGAAGGAGGAGAAGGDSAALGPDAQAISADGTTGGGPLVMAGTPQSLPAAHIGAMAPLGLTGGGLGLLAAAALPPLLGKRRPRSLLPTPTRGSPRD